MKQIKNMSIILFLGIFCSIIINIDDSYAQISRKSDTTVKQASEVLKAAKSNNVERVKILINSGIDINKKSENGDTIYCTALRQNDAQTASILKQFGGSYKGCRGIDPDVPYQAAKTTQNIASSGIFSGITSGTTLLLAGVAVGVGALILTQDEDKTPPVYNPGEGGGPEIPPSPEIGRAFFVPTGANGTYTYNMENDRASEDPIYQTQEYYTITLDTYSAVNFGKKGIPGGNFFYEYHPLGVTSKLTPLYQPAYSAYDAVHVNILRALGYDGTKYTRLNNNWNANNSVVNTTYTSYMKLALISTSGVDINHKDFFRVQKNDNNTETVLPSTEFGFLDGKVYNENTGGIYNKENKTGMLNPFDKGNFADFDVNSKATGLIGVIAAAENNNFNGYNGILGIAPKTEILNFQTQSLAGQLSNPYYSMQKALDEKSNVILFTDTAKISIIIENNGSFNPINRSNSENVLSIWNASGKNLTETRDYFLNEINNLYLNLDTNLTGTTGASVDNLYKTIATLKPRERPVFVFGAGDDNLEKITSIEAMAPLVYQHMNGLFINVVAVDENKDRFQMQMGTKNNGGEIWTEGSNGCGASKNWCLAAPGKNIITLAGGGANITTYGTLVDYIKNFKAYKIKSTSGRNSWEVEDNMVDVDLKIKDLAAIAGIYNAYLTDAKSPFSFYKTGEMNKILDKQFIVDVNGNLVYQGSTEQTPLITGNNALNPYTENLKFGVWDKDIKQFLPDSSQLKYYMLITDKYYELTKIGSSNKTLVWTENEKTSGGIWIDAFSLKSAQGFTDEQKKLTWEYTNVGWVITNYEKQSFTYVYAIPSNENTEVIIYSSTTGNGNIKYYRKDNKWMKSVDGGANYVDIGSSGVALPIPLPDQTDLLTGFLFSVKGFFANYYESNDKPGSEVDFDPTKYYEEIGMNSKGQNLFYIMEKTLGTTNNSNILLFYDQQTVGTKKVLTFQDKDSLKNLGNFSPNQTTLYWKNMIEQPIAGSNVNPVFPSVNPAFPANDYKYPWMITSNKEISGVTNIYKEKNWVYRYDRNVNDGKGAIVYTQLAETIPGQALKLTDIMYYYNPLQGETVKGSQKWFKFNTLAWNQYFISQGLTNTTDPVNKKDGYQIYETGGSSYYYDALLHQWFKKGAGDVWNADTTYSSSTLYWALNINKFDSSTFKITGTMYNNTFAIYEDTTIPDAKFYYDSTNKKWFICKTTTCTAEPDWTEYTDLGTVFLPKADKDPLLGFYFQIGSLYASYGTSVDVDTGIISGGSSTTVQVPTGDYSIYDKTTNLFDFYTKGGVPLNFDFFIRKDGDTSNLLDSTIKDLLSCPANDASCKENGIWWGLSGLAKDVNKDGFLIGVIYGQDPNDPTKEGWQPWQYYNTSTKLWEMWTSVADLAGKVDFDGDGNGKVGVNGEWIPLRDNDFYIDFYFVDVNNNGTYDPEDMLYAPQNGSSAAASMVAGAVTALLGAYQHLTPEQVVSLLFLTADDIGTQGVDEVFGQGFMNLVKATRPYGSLVIPTNPNTFNWNYGHSTFKPGVQPQSKELAVRSAFTADASRVTMSSAFGNVLSGIKVDMIALDDFNREFEMSFDSLVTQRSPVRDINYMMSDFGSFSRENIKISDTMSMTMSFVSNPDTSALKGEHQSKSTFNEITFSFKGEEDSIKFTTGQTITKALAYQEYDSVPTSSLPQSSFVANPYMSFANHNLVGGSYKTKISKNFDFGMTSFAGGVKENDFIDYYNLLNDDHKAGNITSTSATLSYNVKDKGLLSFHSGVVNEDATILGSAAYGALETGDTGTITTFGSTTFMYSFSEKTSFFGGYTIGSSKISTSNYSLFNDFSSVISDSWNLGASHQLSDNSKLGFIFGQPLKVRNGSAELSVPFARDPKEDILYMSNHIINMAPSKTELDLQMFYTYEFGDFGFDSGYIYRLNPGNADIIPEDHTIMMKMRFKI